MISIDQNCHSLWDVVPKLHALQRRGPVQQYVEDIDVAFTSMGSAVESGALRLEQERYYRSGGEDWGAALFYSEFLGCQPVEIRQWEPLTGMKTDVLARHLGRSVDDLYDDFSPGDNWQLVGPSYVGDNRHHRTIGDLSADEVRDYVLQIVGIAREDMQRAFPEAASAARIKPWFERLDANLQTWLGQGGGLDDVYDRWLRHDMPEAPSPQRASTLFPCRAGEHIRLLELFTSDYDGLAGLYNQAIQDSRLGLRTLKVAEGELPFFGVHEFHGHRVRSSALMQNGQLVIGEKSFALGAHGQLPLEAMAQAGIAALPAKAALLVLQVRLGQAGRPLALPYHGSIYMPAAFALERALREQGLLTEAVQSVVRVRLHFLDRLRALETTIHLPAHLQPYFGREEVRARELGEHWQALQDEAQARLEKFRDSSYHPLWQRGAMPELAAQIDELDAARRRLAAEDPKNPLLRELWKRVSPLKVRQLETMVRQISLDWQASRLDYYDSRGAILPWCLALGGEEFYRQLLQKAEIYDERA